MGEGGDVFDDGRALGKEPGGEGAFGSGAVIGLSDGKMVDVDLLDGDILIRRPVAHAREMASVAADEIMAERAQHRLGDLRIRDLIEEGRRG